MFRTVFGVLMLLVSLGNGDGALQEAVEIGPGLRGLVVDRR